jgi:uncharacterized membrane protein YhaH (DUF805 family)
MRPFWMHQVVEYIIGAVFISAGFGGPTPAVPAVLGVIVMLNAAITTGPAAAFRLVDRRVHRILDLVVLALVVIAVVQPWLEIDANARILIAMLGVVLAFVWWNTDFASKDERKQRRRRTPTPDAEAFGRSAGRSAAETYLAAKRLKKAVVDDRRNDASTDDAS